MDCEMWQEKAGALIDAELPDAELGPLYHHLEECAGCGEFFAAALRLRRTMHSDREALLRAAEEDLAPLTPLGARVRRAAPGSWLRALWGRWSVPAPAAVAIAAGLLVGGTWLGTRVGRDGEDSRLSAGAVPPAPPAVVVVCGLPEVEVHAPMPGR